MATDEPRYEEGTMIEVVCSRCGTPAAVCCDDGNDGQGSHADPVSSVCCGPHGRDRTGLERMDCDS
jgi:hypothetical protein